MLHDDLSMRKLCAKLVPKVLKTAKNDWVLHHDNAPSNTSLKVQQFLTIKNIRTLSLLPVYP